MNGKRVLIVEDEASLRQALQRALARYGYQLEVAADGEAALDVVASWKPDLIVLDLVLPKRDGFAVLQHVRAESQLPIIVLSARGREHDKVRALDLGADDYLTKPFSIAELLARMRAVLRRSSQQDVPGVAIGDVTIDFEQRLVTKAGKEVRLTPKEYALLRALALHPGKVITHRQLLRDVWGDHDGENVAEVRVYVNYLRRKLEEDPVNPRLLLTELGVGYRLRAGE
jgi:two-component system, OmpR family, KDP operon response regulator KdpE